MGYRGVFFTILLTLAATLCGCQLNSAPQRSATPIGPPRSGDVYLVRGLLGTFSTGMDDLRDQLARRGVRSVALQHTEGASAARWIIQNHHPSAGPVILIGHSLGADEVIAIANRLAKAKVPVDLLITLDAVNAHLVPPNVHRALNYYRSGAFDILPAFRGIPLKTRTKDSPSSLTNIDLNDHPELVEPGTNHFTIDTNNILQKTIIDQVLSVCPMETGSPEPIPAAVTLSAEKP